MNPASSFRKASWPTLPPASRNATAWLRAGIAAIATVGASLNALAWTEQELNTQGLQGTLTLPDDAASSVPAVLILAGSGPVNRDGNLRGARNNSLKLLAHGLAGQGIASLRVDKRGVARSAAAALHEDDLRFDAYVRDAQSWIELLRAQPRVSRVAVLGHSEGALVATLAAQRTTVEGLILIAGAGEPAFRLIARQLAASGAPAALQDESRSIADSLARGEAVPTVSPALASLYRPSVQNYLMSWFPLDPARELSKVTVPVLIVQGTTDLQIGVDDARRLAGARPGAMLTVIDGMNHVLKTAPAERAANLATYDAWGVPLAAALVPAIAAFVASSQRTR